MLTLTSLYEKSWDGTYRLVPTPVLPSNSIPSYWPEVTEPFLCGQKITVSNPPPVVPPKTPPGGVPRHYEQTGVTDATPSSWINVYETGQQGQRIIVGRTRSYYGNMSTVEEFNLPLAWLSQHCFRAIGDAVPIRIDSISIECAFLEKARFGLGTVQILSTDARKVVLP